MLTSVTATGVVRSGAVTLTGAEGLLPDSASHYQVKLEWWLEDGQWQLARLNWE